MIGRRSALVLALSTALVATPLVQWAGTGIAAAAGTLPFVVGTPTVATITNGATAAPWNEAQGDSGTAAYPSSDLLPTYTPGGSSTGSGSTAEPNVAVYPGAGSTVAGASPYPSGVVGTPGPLDGYCGSGTNTTESSGSPVRQPAGTTLPFAPAYFPHIVRNADGTLTGYFDERPKDADESIVVATSTDNGKDWTYQGQALEENPGYCPSADINDDGEGHPNILTINGKSILYTLQRPAGDNAGVGMLVHPLTATGADTLAGLPSSEQVGIDPDTQVYAPVTVPPTGSTGVAISVTQTGQTNSPEQLVAGPFVDLNVTPTPTASSIITCTGVGTGVLTGCTAANPGGESLGANDVIEQVIGKVSTAETIPTGPNNTLGTGGLSSLPVAFTNNITSTILNNNAPNRISVDGIAVYCNQSNANPTTKVEDCTTGPGGPSVSAAVGDPVTADPVVPTTAQQTSGLVAPDGIVGTLPSYPGDGSGSVPPTATYVMYTEKLLNYFIAGVTSAAGTYSSTTGSTITFFTNPNTSASLPTPSAGSPVTVDVADDTKKIVIQAACTGSTAPTGSMQSNSSPQTESLTGCLVPAADSGDTYTTKDQIGAPGAALESPNTLAETGEGSTSQDKLYKNNEDLTVLRVAWTTDGITFSSTGLANGGVISGQGTEGANYNDISSPSSTADPPLGLNQYATAGSADATEMRWVGSAGTIIATTDSSGNPIDELFLSGAWPADGDSDAFNQVFYTTSSDGESWSVPIPVVSTDYTFAASVAQDSALASGSDTPLGISAYYSGRAYGPSVVPNNDGSGDLTMVFAGYRLPKPITTAGTVLGTNTSAQYTIGATDPALYRDILTVTLSPTPSTGAPEAPNVLLLPFAALLVGGGALVFVRRRRSRFG